MIPSKLPPDLSTWNQSSTSTDSIHSASRSPLLTKELPTNVLEWIHSTRTLGLGSNHHSLLRAVVAVAPQQPSNQNIYDSHGNIWPSGPCQRSRTLVALSLSLSVLARFAHRLLKLPCRTALGLWTKTLYLHNGTANKHHIPLDRFFAYRSSDLTISNRPLQCV